uniref:Uncharacterized protein n=1 Tax=Anoplophora glabripennis TaxID=217634 RepID=V5GWW1_ANOGL
MSMAYVSDIDSELVDLNSAVIHLQTLLSSLTFNAEHEANYGMDGLYSTTGRRNQAETLNCAYNTCERYLASKINIDVLVHTLHELHLTPFILQLEHFLPLHLQKYLARILNDDKYDSDVDEGNETGEEDNLNVVEEVLHKGEEDGEMEPNQ